MADTATCGQATHKQVLLASAIIEVWILTNLRYLDGLNDDYFESLM